MSFFKQSSLLFTIALLAGPTFAQNIDNCPSTETIVQDSTGNSWAVCPYTDYDQGNLNMFTGIQSAQACADSCAKTSGCVRSVWDHSYFYCHLKPDTSGQWEKNSKYDAIRPYTGRLSSCPVAETIVNDKNGRSWAICPFSDFTGSLTKTVAVASNTACLQSCASTTGCVQAVYDRPSKNCYLKTKNDFNWVTSQKADSIRLLAASQFTCGGQQSTLTTTDGSTFALCTNTDFQGASIYVLNNYASSQACAEAYSLTPVCSNAIWDKNNNICHMKGDLIGLTQASNNQFDQIRLIRKASPKTQSVSSGGQWGKLITFPVVPAASYVVPEQPQGSKLMMYSAAGALAFGGSTGSTKFATFNYVTGAISDMIVANTNHDMFCPGMSTLPNGNMVVTGGDNAAVTSIYDPIQNTWTRGPDMNFGRGYQSSTVLSNGNIFTIGGSFTGGEIQKNGEVYDSSSNTWTLLNGCDASKINTDDIAWRKDNHAWLHAWTDGSVFHAGPSRNMNWFGTSNGGSVVSAGQRNATNDHMCGTNVMYDTGKILAAGGTLVYDDSPGQTTSYVISINKTGNAATVEKNQDLKYPRAYANSLVLPDGSVMVSGGQKRSRQFTDIESFTYPELWSPKTKTWRTLNPESVPRNYHASTLLLGDGTVFTGGGGLCYVGNGDSENNWGCDVSAQHPNGQIFSPPYLFNSDGSLATRPSITKIVSTSDANQGYYARAGEKIAVTMSNTAATTFSLLRMGSSTHTVNTDQRRLSLTAVQSGSTWNIVLPSDYGIILPGYWYLFALSSSGTPSIAKVIQIRL